MDIRSIAIAVANDLCRRANSIYRQALDKADFDKAGITEPLVLAHFLAQVFHETGGLTILYEDLNYSAKRMTEVWPGRFPTIASAEPYAHNPEALGEKSYGGRMGNSKPGYGFKFRGRGGTQLTGFESYLAFSRAYGVDFVSDPDLICTPEYALASALFEWKQKNCTALAKKNNIAGVTHSINGGLIGFDDRVKWFNRIWPKVQKYAGLEATPSWQHADEDDDIRDIQTKLVAAGYPVDVDGRKGPETTEAIKRFQQDNGLQVDGVCGDVTMRVLSGKSADTKMPRVAAPKEPANTAPAGLVGLGLGEAGQTVLDKVDTLKPVADGIPYLSYALTAISIIAVGLIAWGVIGPTLHRAFRPGAPA